MRKQMSEAAIPAFDPAYFAAKKALFEREYSPQAAEWMIQALGSRYQPDVEITFEEIREQYPYYLKLLVDDPALGAFVERYLDKLQPYCQSPFALPGQQVVQGPWLNSHKLYNFSLCEVNAETVAQKRVLDVGANAGFDTFYLSTLGASDILGVEPAPLFYYQALLLWAIYDCPNLRFLNIGWESIRKEVFGTFDLINCQGLLYHQPSPMLLLEGLFDLLAPGGKLVLETHITLDDDLKARFVEGAFWGDNTWFWIPSEATMCAMLRAVGFEEAVMRAHYPSQSKNSADPLHTVEGVPVGGRGFFTAQRPVDERILRPKYGS